MKKMNKSTFALILVLFALVLVIPANSLATVYTLDLALSSQNEVPPNASPATGTLTGTYDDVTNLLTFSIMFNGLVAPVVAAHFHGPAAPGVNAGVQIPLVGFPVGVPFGSYSNTVPLTPEQESDLLCGLWYVNIHTAAFPGGEIRSQLTEGVTIANITPLDLGLTGLNEVPPNASPATGIFTATYDASANLLTLSIKFNGLIGPVTAAHIHGPATPGVNAPVIIPLTGFPVGVPAGTYANVFPVTPDQEALLLAGLTYVNIHTAVFPGGEIRGQLIEGTLTGTCGVSVIPVSNWALLIGGLLIVAYAVFMIRRRA